MARSKFELYEKSVQSPDHHVQWFDEVYRNLRGREARVLREDFCGTFLLGTTWVQLRPENRAICLDLDEETLAYGMERNRKVLKPEEARRLSALRRDVLSVTRPPVDLQVACNFSFFIFHEREQLLKYFRAAHRSLADDGMFILDLAGGPGMIESIRERKVNKKRGRWEFTYVWDQKSFDPINNRGQYAIHFNLADGTRMTDAFTYDWRLWSIPEVRDALREAGFSDVRVYWETSHEEEGTGEYAISESGDNAWSWIAYVVGFR